MFASPSRTTTQSRLWAGFLFVLVSLDVRLVVGGAPAAAVVPAVAEATTEVAQISLGDLHPFAFTNKGEYVVGEPVFLHLVIANGSANSTFELQGYLHPANDFEIKVARSREMPKRFTAGVGEDALFPGVTFRIEPRQLVALRWALCHEAERARGFLFDQRGRYTITCQARVTINKQVPQVLKFAEIQVEIKDPTGEDAKALAWLLRPDCAEDLQRLQAREETAKVWQELIERFPGSLWMPYARFLLARLALEQGGIDYAEVAKQLESLVREYPNFPLHGDAYYFLASCQDRLGRPVEALRWLYRIQREHPISPYAQSNSRLFRKYIYLKGREDRYAPWYLRE